MPDRLSMSVSAAIPVAQSGRQVGNRRSAWLLTALATALLAAGSLPVQAQEVDSDGAMAIARKGSCLRCHAVDKRKKAPSYQEIGKKFAAKADGEAALTRHVTGKNKVML